VDDQLLTITEVAALLQVPKSFIYARSRLGAIPVFRIGRHLRFPARELTEWVELQRVGAPRTPAAERKGGAHGTC
jgi:excisionase family DNA binding protein